MADMAVLSSLIAVVMAFAHYLPLQGFAAVMGIAAVSVMACENLAAARSRWLAWGWMTFSAAYVVAVIAAVLRG
jgi:hypothetical protein